MPPTIPNRQDALTEALVNAAIAVYHVRQTTGGRPSFPGSITLSELDRAARAYEEFTAPAPRSCELENPEVCDACG